MFEYILESSLHLLRIFTLSGLSAYAVCKIMKKPFFNPSLNNSGIIDKLQQSLMSYSGIYVQAAVIASIAYPYLDSGGHSFIRSISNIAEYALWIELFYYAYHRTLHNSWAYKQIHAFHHENTKVYPIDTVHLGQIDSIGLMLTLVAPMWFVQVDFCEYSTIVYVYLTGAFLSHSDVIVNHHSIHHKEFKVNYCFLFPIFDIAFGTYKP
jgi:sterol desaturase/sphingolipid hydroxylase (fatty acid hydroxylase superfamily)